MWQANWRSGIPALLRQEWDIVIVGGGITGAGILLEAARRGLRAVLVEQRDFAWGTSSRSSKLVHGGLRYLKEGKLLLTRASVKERQALLEQAPGLVEPQGFAFADYKGKKPGRWMFALGLAVYDFLAGQHSRHYYSSEAFLHLAPHIDPHGLQGGLCYTDAKTDDARLVLRVLQDAISTGGHAINYLAATQLLRDQGRVSGIEVRDGINDELQRINARVVINATGAWADGLRGQLGYQGKIRPLRGSHLIFPAWRVPVAQAVSLMHPQDGRPVFIFPWEGVTLVGTTDVDHQGDLNLEAAITQAELDYLMVALRCQFPALNLHTEDIVSTYAGVRPVIDTGKRDPSKEGRDHAVWQEQGLLTVTGGKLTTFHEIALDVLRKAAPAIPDWKNSLRPQRIFDEAVTDPLPASLPSLTSQEWMRLSGRHGRHARAMIQAAHDSELETIPGTETLWVELRWAARTEAVVHLEDLLLRRTRLGLQLRKGGKELMPRIRSICQAELAWDDERWEREQRSYLQLCQSNYSVPGRMGSCGTKFSDQAISPKRILRSRSMANEYILSIDNGTQSVRALLFDLHGRIVAKSQVFLEAYYSTQPGWAEHDPEDYWQAMCAACQRLWAEVDIAKDAILGVTVTTQRATMINLDARGRPLRPAIVWLDQRRADDVPPMSLLWRTAFKLARVENTIKFFRREAEANWIKSNEPEIWARTDKFIMLSGYLNYRLCGDFIDSYASQVGYIPFDFKRLQWAGKYDWKWQALPITRSMLPDLVPPGAIMGKISAQAASDTGIPAGLPLIAAAADKACEVIGAGCLEPHIGCLSYGTTATINTTNTRYVEVTPYIPPYPAAVPGAYSTEVQIFRGYWMVNWFKEQFGHLEQSMAASQGIMAEDLFDDLVNSVPPGSMGLMLQPYWSPGVTVPGPEAKGAVIGFGDVHHRGHFYRAILEGLAYALREGKERTEKRSGVKITALRVSGGGSQSDAAMQLTADIFGLPTARPHIYETSGLGAAIDAVVGLGLYPDFKTAIAAMTRIGRIFEPIASNQKIYDELYRRVYQKMYSRLKPLYHDIQDITGYPH